MKESVCSQNFVTIFKSFENRLNSIFHRNTELLKGGNVKAPKNSIYYEYEKMIVSKEKVKKGEKESTGKVIGNAFTNNIKGETLLGFRIYKNDQVQNPEPWLAKF